MAPTWRTSLPARRAASAWLAPLLPGAVAKVPPSTVSPGPGRRGTEPVRSRPTEPNTVIIYPPRHGPSEFSGLHNGVPVAVGPQQFLAERLADQRRSGAVAA